MPAECGGACRWPHAYREDGLTRCCPGPVNRVTRFLRWLRHR